MSTRHPNEESLIKQRIRQSTRRKNYSNDKQQVYVTIWNIHGLLATIEGYQNKKFSKKIDIALKDA